MALRKSKVGDALWDMGCWLTFRYPKSRVASHLGAYLIVASAMLLHDPKDPQNEASEG